MATALESFFVELGFEIDTNELDKFEKSLQNARSTVMSIAGIAAAAAAAIGLFTFKIADSLDDLGDFADREQVSAEAIQELGHAAQMEGSSLEALQSSIEGLNRVTGEAINGLGRGKKAFEKFGLSAKDGHGEVKTFDVLLGEIADKMQGMSRQAAIGMATKLGLDRSLIPLLMKGRDALEAYRQEARDLGISTQEDIDTAGHFKDAWDRLHFVLLNVTRSIAVKLMPQIMDIIIETRRWIVANRELIANTIGRALEIVSTILATMWDWMGRVLALFGPFVDWLSKSNVLLYAMGAALAVIIKVSVYKGIQNLASAFGFLAKMISVANVAALITTVAIGAIIAGIALLIDDYVNWKEGNDSVIGSLIEKFPWLLEVITTIQNAVQTFTEFWLQQWGKMEGPLSELGAAIWNLIKTVDTALWPIIKMAFEGWVMLLSAIVPYLAPIITFLAEVLVGAIGLVVDSIAWLTGVFTALFDGIDSGIKKIIAGFVFVKTTITDFLGLLSGAWDKLSSLLGIGNASLQLGVSGSATQTQPLTNALAAPGGVLGNATTNNASSVQSTTITGTTIQIVSPDPNKAGESVKTELDRMNRTATRNGQSAVVL